MPSDPPQTPQNLPVNSRKKAVNPPILNPPYSPPLSDEIHKSPSRKSEVSGASTREAISSSSSGLKLPNNVPNVCQSLADEGFYFDEEGSCDKYPELQKVVNKIFNHERYSAVRPNSVKA